MDQNTKNKISKGVNKAYENQALRKHLSRVGKGAKNSQAKAVVCMTGIVNNYSQKIFPYMGAAEEWMELIHSKRYIFRKDILDVLQQTKFFRN